MSSQFSLGLGLVMGKNNTFVVCFNSPLTVANPKGYPVTIAKPLVKSGVKTLSNGKIKFPGKKVVIALVVFDDDFEQCKVIIPSQAAMVAASLEMKSEPKTPAKSEAEDRDLISKLLTLIPQDGETAKLLMTAIEYDINPIKKVLDDLYEKFKSFNYDRIATELTAAAESYTADLAPIEEG